MCPDRRLVVVTYILFKIGVVTVIILYACARDEVIGT